MKSLVIVQEVEDGYTLHHFPAGNDEGHECDEDCICRPELFLDPIKRDKAHYVHVDFDWIYELRC